MITILINFQGAKGFNTLIAILKRPQELISHFEKYCVMKEYIPSNL